MRRRWIPLLGLGLAVFGSAAPARAQFPDIGFVSAQYLPGTDLPGEEASVQVATYEAGFNAPIPLAEKTFLIPGLTYHVESLSFSGDLDAITQLRTFHSVELPILFVQLLPHDWALSLRFSTSLAGDYQGVDPEMLIFSAVALATHTFNEQVVFGFGGIASYTFGSFLPLPALYLEYKPTDYFTLETFLPAFVSARFILGDERVELGVRAEFQGSSYAVRDERVRGTWPCVGLTDDPMTAPDESVADGSSCLDHFAYSVGSVGASAGVRLVSSLWLSVFAGHTVYRRYEPQNADNDALPGQESTLPLSPIVRADLVFRIPRGE